MCPHGLGWERQQLAASVRWKVWQLGCEHVGAVQSHPIFSTVAMDLLKFKRLQIHTMLIIISCELSFVVLVTILNYCMSSREILGTDVAHGVSIVLCHDEQAAQLGWKRLALFMAPLHFAEYFN